MGDDRDVLRLCPGITGAAMRKYRLEDEMIADYVASRQAAGDMRPMQEIAVEYNDTMIYPDKVRLNCYYYRHYSFVKDIQMIFCTVLGRRMRYGGGGDIGLFDEPSDRSTFGRLQGEKVDDMVTNYGMIE